MKLLGVKSATYHAGFFFYYFIYFLKFNSHNFATRLLFELIINFFENLSQQLITQVYLFILILNQATHNAYYFLNFGLWFLNLKYMIYHAGLSPQRKTTAHRKFVRDELQVLYFNKSFLSYLFVSVRKLLLCNISKTVFGI